MSEDNIFCITIEETRRFEFTVAGDYSLDDAVQRCLEEIADGNAIPASSDRDISVR